MASRSNCAAELRITDSVGRSCIYVSSALVRKLNESFRNIDVHGPDPIAAHVKIRSIPVHMGYRRITRRRRFLLSRIEQTASGQAEALRRTANTASVASISVRALARDGKTSSEFEMVLDISAPTVYFRLKNTALKINVHGTRPAIGRAMEPGLI
jgi:hypothetical protein